MPTSTLARAPTGIYWYDLETSRTHTASDRIMQFAGCRTDAESNIVDQPYVGCVEWVGRQAPRADGPTGRYGLAVVSAFGGRTARRGSMSSTSEVGHAVDEVRAAFDTDDQFPHDSESVGVVDVGK